MIVGNEQINNKMIVGNDETLFQLCVDQIRQAEPVWSSLAVSHSRQSVRLRLPLQGR